MSETRQGRSLGGAIGGGLGSIAKFALDPRRRNRTLRAAGVGLQATAASVRKATRTLWLEVTGFVFLIFAIVGGGAAIREFHRYSQGEPVLAKLVTASVFALVFAWFGVSSFWKARRS